MRNLLATSDERVFFKALESRFVLVSAGWLEGVGHSLETVIGKTDLDVFSQPHATAAIHDEQRIIRTGEAMVAKIERDTFHDRPGAWVSTTKMPLRDADGEIIGNVWDHSTSPSRARRALVHQAMHDSVTGLANRVALMDRLGRALVNLERQPGRLALLFIDIELLQRADIAMYAAKRAGRDRLQVYNARLRRRVEANRGLAADLRQAIDRSQLSVVYQPVWRLQAGGLSGVEALVRWQHPERGMSTQSSSFRSLSSAG